jgi:HEAT repeat protein
LPISEPPRKKRPQGFSDDVVEDCLRIMASASGKDLFEIIPRVGVLRDPRFSEPLAALLVHKDLKRREFAAYAMGAMGDRRFLEPLRNAFTEALALKGSHAEDLQVAIVEAIGAIGDDRAVAFFMPMLKVPPGNRQERQIQRWMLEALGAVAQQGGDSSLTALLELATQHQVPELRAQAIMELSVAYWHRPNRIPSRVLARICESTRDQDAVVSESAIAALRSLADVGCRRAEMMFSDER